MSNVDNIPELLKKIPKPKANLTTDLGNEYNIFTVMGIEYNEVIVCRFIGNLLDPKGGHGLGDKPLRHFIHDVLKDGTSDENLEKAIINLEEHTNNDRRVDIVIHLGTKVYPIEVKIWAGDQNKQLEDYHHYFFGENGQKKIYYLTPEGRKPSEKSKGGLSKDQISRISFSEDIIHWLDEIKETASDHIKFVIMNFMEVINKMNEQSTELNNILNSLELNNGKYNTDDIKGTIALLKYHDEIWDKIRRNYLQKIVSLENGYTLDECEKKDNGISHILMCVRKNNEKIAWICVETNLYIVVKKKRGEVDKDWVEYNSDFQWRYIEDPNNPNKHIQLNTPTEELPEIKIKLEQVLSELE